jgi:hypothetical protein
MVNVKESENHNMTKGDNLVVIIMVVEVKQTLVKEIIEITIKGEK